MVPTRRKPRRVGQPFSASCQPPESSTRRTAVDQPRLATDSPKSPRQLPTQGEWGHAKIVKPGPAARGVAYLRLAPKPGVNLGHPRMGSGQTDQDGLATLRTEDRGVPTRSINLRLERCWAPVDRIDLPPDWQEWKSYSRSRAGSPTSRKYGETWGTPRNYSWPGRACSMRRSGISQISATVTNSACAKRGDHRAVTIAVI